MKTIQFFRSGLVVLCLFVVLPKNVLAAPVFTQADYLPFAPGLSWRFQVTGMEWQQPVGGTRTENNYFIPSNSLQLQSTNLSVGSHTATILGLNDGGNAGAPNYAGDYFGVEADGLIDYGTHPLKLNSEIYDNGRILVPAAMEVGQSYVDPRLNAWHGIWDDGVAWTGSASGTISVIGFEDVVVPAGTFHALRVELADTREKTALTDPGRQSHEQNTQVLWLAENIGFIKSEWNQDIQYYWNSTLQSTAGSQSINELTVPLPPAFLLLGSGLLVMFRALRRNGK